MTGPRFSILPNRGVIAVAGEDRVEFLQGLISNDVTKVAPAKAVWAALLTPQGRFLNDMFVVDAGFGTLLLETEREKAPALARKLGMYKLRSKVTVEDRSATMDVAVVFGPGAEKHNAVPGALSYVDPRLPELGVRVLTPAGQAGKMLGLPEAPLADAASGGELSRVLLALHGVAAAAEPGVAWVFDEVDAGVGGAVAEVIGQKIRQVASRHQVLCITHLAQIAVYGDRHFVVQKHAVGDRTQSTVRVLDLAGESVKDGHAYRGVVARLLDYGALVTLAEVDAIAWLDEAIPVAHPATVSSEEPVRQPAGEEATLDRVGRRRRRRHLRRRPRLRSVRRARRGRRLRRRPPTGARSCVPCPP